MDSFYGAMPKLRMVFRIGARIDRQGAGTRARAMAEWLKPRLPKTPACSQSTDGLSKTAAALSADFETSKRLDPHVGKAVLVAAGGGGQGTVVVVVPSAHARGSRSPAYIRRTRGMARTEGRDMVVSHKLTAGAEGTILRASISPAML